MKIAIVGAAYTGLEAARYLRSKGHEISVTTTREARATELAKVADRVVVMKGSDRAKMRELIADQHVVLLTMAGGLTEKDGKPHMDPELYRDSYVGTAESLVENLDAAPGLNQIVFCSSLNAYGDAGGAERVDEETPPNATSPFAQVYIETENLLAGVETDELKVCNFRTGTIYGPTRAHASEAARIAGQQIPFDGDSDAMIVHRDDVVRGLDFAIEKHLSGLYNLFNDVTESKAEFFGKVCEKAGLEPITWLGLSKGPRGVSNAKIKAAGFTLADPHCERETDDLLL
ncbi:MAG: NAD-dependent epimerase/dehydratase family protein [Chromatiales bacterium]|nr:MAG: NAD-dependent epimerase/dehydratase family protein [Chromatiales bacterium]